MKKLLIILGVAGLITSCKKTNKDVVLSYTSTATVTTFAGSGQPGKTNGNGTQASFYQPNAITTDPSGNVYVSDFGNSLIRKITAGGNVTTFANFAGYSLTCDANSNIYVSEGYFIYVLNSTGQKIDSLGYGNPLFNHNGPFINGIAVYNGSVFGVNTSQNEIDQLTLTGNVGIFAGTGYPGDINGTIAQATFNSPFNISVDNAGTLFVTDGTQVRKITTSGSVSTFINVAVGGIAIDNSDNLYLVTRNNSNLISLAAPNGTITNIAGTYSVGLRNGVGDQALFSGIGGMCYDGKGNLYVIDTGNDVIRKVAID